MTFTLLRAGLPNTVIAAALAATPIIAIALSLSQPSPHPSAHRVETVAAASQRTGAAIRFDR